MSNLKPSMLSLDKGLNLQVAKIAAPQGSVLDSLNYEQVDFQGQKRIDGFTRFDGSFPAAINEYYVFVLSGVSSIVADGSLLSSDSGLFGVVVGQPASGTYHVAAINKTAFPSTNGNVYVITSSSSDLLGQLTSYTAGVQSGATADEHYQNLLTYNNVLRASVGELPGPIAGLHWFRDRLHAIAGVTYASLDGTTPAIYPGDVLVAGGDTANVLDVITLGNTRAVFLDSLNPTVWETEGTAVTRDGSSVGSVANGYEPITTDELASIFEARSEQQVLDETASGDPYQFGWKFRHLGWKILFENGSSLYGALPAVNQNRGGLGIEGPTSIVGNNGAAAAISQNVDVTNLPTQINGWKDSSTSSSYALNPAAIQYDGDNTIYADAYIYWDAETGAVVGDNGTLTENSPVNTVEII